MYLCFHSLNQITPQVHKHTQSISIGMLSIAHSV